MKPLNAMIVLLALASSVAPQAYGENACLCAYVGTVDSHFDPEENDPVVNSSNEPQDATEPAEQNKSNAVDTELKALEDRKKKVELELAILKAEQDLQRTKLLGSAATPEFKGSVELKEGAGLAESRALVSMAIKKAATLISKDIRRHLKPPSGTASQENPKLLVLTVDELQEAMQGLNTLTKIEPLKQQFKEAGVQPPKEGHEAAVGAAIGAALQIASMLRSDFTVGGMDIKSDATQLIAALAAQLSEYNLLVRASLYGLQAPENIQVLFRDLDTVALLFEQAKAMKGKKEKELDQLKQKDKNSTDKNTIEEQKKALQKQIEALSEVCGEYLKFQKELRAIGVLGIFLSAVFTSGGARMLGSEGVIVVVKVENTAGSYYTKRDLFSGFGKMPFYHSGSAVVSYLLLRAKGLTVLGGDTIPVYSGFVKANQVEGFVSRPSSERLR